MANRLEINNLESVRDDRVLFENLSFSVGEGQIVQIDGPNGSGKTTLLRMICGLHLPESGEILWNGKNILRHRFSFLGRLAYVGHSIGVKDDLTPQENLRMAQALQEGVRPLSIDAALEQVGLRGFEDLKCRSLSAGQKRRVAIARLLLVDSILWVLDEPLTAVDKQGITVIESMLVEHSRRGGLTVITSHQRLRVSACEMQHVQL